VGFLADFPGKARREAAVDDISFCVEPGVPVCLSPEPQYLRVWLRSALLTKVRRWTSKVFPAVHARFAYADRTAGMTEVTRVVSPGKAFEATDPRNLNRLQSANLPLLGPVPFRGDLNMEVAVFGVAGADLTQPVLELLPSRTNTAGVAFLGSLKPFVDPIRRDAELRCNADGEPMVARILRPFEPGRPARWYIDTKAAAAQLRFIEDCDPQELGGVQAEFSGLPVLRHGHDHLIPGGALGDLRRPKWARPTRCTPATVTRWWRHAFLRCRRRRWR